MLNRNAHKYSYLQTTIQALSRVPKMQLQNGGKIMTKNEEMIVLAGYLAAVLLLWTPVIIDTIRQEKKHNKRKGK